MAWLNNHPNTYIFVRLVALVRDFEVGCWQRLTPFGPLAPFQLFNHGDHVTEHTVQHLLARCNGQTIRTSVAELRTVVYTSKNVHIIFAHCFYMPFTHSYKTFCSLQVRVSGNYHL